MRADVLYDIFNHIFVLISPLQNVSTREWKDWQYMQAAEQTMGPFTIPSLSRSTVSSLDLDHGSKMTTFE